MVCLFILGITQNQDEHVECVKSYILELNDTWICYIINCLNAASYL